MAPNGPILPRKDTALARAANSIESLAFQIGVIVSIQRNRIGLKQRDLADEVGCSQIDISNIENGRSTNISDKVFDALFDHLELIPRGQAHANFLKWWRDNPPS